MSFTLSEKSGNLTVEVVGAEMVRIGLYELTMTDFCGLARHVMTATQYPRAIRASHSSNLSEGSC